MGPRGTDVIGWDLEIALEFPEGLGDSPDWLTVEESLGISCAAVAGSKDDLVRLTFAPTGWSIEGDERGTRMTPESARGMADWLYDVQKAGALIVTWNGAGFDFPVLARECESDVYTEMIAQLTLDHCDMGFAMVCDKGYMVGLNTAAKALGLEGKTEGMSGSLAPILWTAPERDLTDLELAAVHDLGVTPGTKEARQLCIEYVEQDAVTTRDVYWKLMEERNLVWVTRRGTLARYPWVPYVLDGHIATVWESLRLTPPDTSWMNKPRTRGDYIGWALDTLRYDRGRLYQ